MSHNQSRYQKTLTKLETKQEQFSQVCGALPQTFQAMVSLVDLVIYALKSKFL
jgi:hypothetical protein